MGSGSSVQCSVCTSSSYGRCDHCRRRFCSSHFHSHQCTGVSGYGNTTVHCKSECDSCNNDAVGTPSTRHRESLFGEMEKIVESRNQLQEIINESMHPVIAEIDEWEKTTIRKIQDVAALARQKTIDLLNTNQTKVHTEFKNFSQELATLRESGDFLEHDLDRLNEMINQFKLDIRQSTQHADIILHSEQSDQIIWENLIYVEEVQQSRTTNQTNFHRAQLKSNLKWKPNATIVAGGNEQGDKLNQLSDSQGIYVDYQQQAIYIADCGNHRIVQWKLGENSGQIVAGGNGRGKRIDQLDLPTDMIVDQNNKSLIICDWGNRRVVRWSLENQQDKQIIIENIGCCGLMMNENGDLFVSDCENDEVKRWSKGEIEGTIVAGGNGRGDQLNQLYKPTYIFIDRQETVYVSDWRNHRVMKWMKGAKEGIVVAGGHGQGNSLKQLFHPNGLIVNEVGDVYVADSRNDRIMCWPSGLKEGRVIVGKNGKGEGSTQFTHLEGLSFDVENNLYVVDCENHRIQRLSVDKN